MSDSAAARIGKSRSRLRQPDDPLRRQARALKTAAPAGDPPSIKETGPS